MLKNLFIPATTVLAFTVAPLSFADDMASGETKADREQTTQMMHDDDSGMTAEQRFNDLDTNRDGSLSEEELNAWGSTAAGNPATGTTLIDDYDTNDDGQLSKDEAMVSPLGSNDDSNM